MTTNRKATSPLDIMLQNRSVPNVQASISKNNEKKFTALAKPDERVVENILEVNIKDIRIWGLKDHRSESDRSKRKLEELVDRIKTHGQLVPCIIIKIDDEHYKYDLIAGRRRFLAAQKLGINLKAIIKDVKNESEALILQHEEHERENPTDYERGKHYNRLLCEGRFTNQAELARFFKKDTQEISKVLTYFKLPKLLHDAIEDFDNVTYNTAGAIASLATKSDAHLNALISLAEEIREGKGHSAIRKLVENIVNKKTINRYDFIPKKVIDSGRHLLTWKVDSNDNISISFPANISDILPQQALQIAIVKTLNEHINKLILPSGGQNSNKLPSGGEEGD